MKNALILVFTFLPFLGYANSIKLSDVDYRIHGGISGNVQFQKHSASQEELGTAINDFIIALKPIPTDETITVNAAVGNLQQQDFFFTTAPTPPMDLGLLYGWFNIKPNDLLHLEMGLIESKSKYEKTISFNNPNIMMGMTRRSQANYYTGFRLNLEDKDIPLKFHIEYGAPDNITETQLAAGINWTYKNHYVSVNLLNATDEKQTLNTHGNFRLHNLLSVGFNIDRHDLTEFPKEKNNIAFGLAAYATLHFEDLTIPVRGEIIEDKDTNMYQLGRAYSLTISPSMKLKKNTYARVDVFYVKSSAKPFKDDRSFVNNQAGSSVQLIWKF